MSSVHLDSRWRRQALHAVITATEEQGTQNIDQEMYADIDFPCFGARSLVKRASPILCWFRRDSPYQETCVDKEDCCGKCNEQ